MPGLPSPGRLPISWRSGFASRPRCSDGNLPEVVSSPVSGRSPSYRSLLAARSPASRARLFGSELESMMIYVGIDDTDTLDDPGTNQLARHLVGELSNEFEARLILRHQLLQ